MSQTLERVRSLVARGEARVSDHGYEELAADGLLVRDVVDGLADATVVEGYPDYPKGPCMTIRKGHAFWFWNTIETVNQFM